MSQNITASYFLNNELAVFECKPDRTPKAKGWRDSEYWMIDPEEADSWKCYGVALESKWLVIDVDLRKPEAHSSFSKLQEFIDFSQCFTCKTARGGFHYWFKNPTEQPIRKTLHEFKGVDFLSEGCYVIGPYSVADTGVYAFEHGALLSSPEASDRLLEILSKRKIIDGGTIQGIQTSLEQSRYKQWLDAQPQAVAGENGNDYTYNMMAFGFDFGLSPDEILEAAQEWNEKNLPPWSTEELERLISHAARYAQNAKGKAAINFEAFTASEPIETNENTGSPQIEGQTDDIFDSLHPGVGLTYRGDHILPSASNIRIVLLSDRYRGIFTWDSFRSKIVLDRVPPWRGDKQDISLDMNDIDWRELRVDLSIQARLECPTYLLEDGVYSLAKARKFHPLQDWLNGLHWDGTPRIGRIFGFGEYQHNVARTFLLASIYRVFYPGYKFDHMLVIAGRQGIGKSYLIQILGGDYAKSMMNTPTNSRGLQETQGAWWLELPELSAVKKADINQVKAWVTNTKDTFIPLYGRSGPQDFPRGFIPVWTLNPTESGFLSDNENRRFIIIEQKQKIDIDFVKANRDQIFAEAMEMYRAGIHPHKLVETFKDEAEQIATDYKQDESDIWDEIIYDWLIRNNKTRFEVKEIYKDALNIYREIDIDKKTQLRVGQCLRRLGYYKKKSMGKYYYVKENEESIESEFEV